MSQIARVKIRNMPSETVEFVNSPGTYETARFTEGELGFIAQSVSDEESDRVAFEVPQNHSTTESVDGLLAMAGAPLNPVIGETTLSGEHVSFRGGEGVNYYAAGGEYAPMDRLPVVLYARAKTERELDELIDGFGSLLEELR
ncbi:hypothetical protein [Haloferax gibbonsii]|nr:hypothetical protein [Haloferax gibbonsii]